MDTAGRAERSFLGRALQARRQWKHIVRVLKGGQKPPRLQGSQDAVSLKCSSRNEGPMKDIQSSKLERIFRHRTVLREMEGAVGWNDRWKLLTQSCKPSQRGPPRFLVVLKYTWV